jgi:hypothetical protein
MEHVAVPRGIVRVGEKFRADSTKRGPLRTNVTEAKKDLALLRRGLLLSVAKHKSEENITEENRREEKTRGEKSIEERAETRR